MDMEIVFRTGGREGAKIKLVKVKTRLRIASMEKLLFTAFPDCGTMLRLALEGSTAEVNQYYHICDDHRDMDISTTDTSLPYSAIQWEYDWLRTHTLSFASTLEANDVTTALSAIYSAFIYSFIRNIPQQKQTHGLRRK